MNQISIDEQLSALADGELERGPARFLLRRLENEPVLAQRFERYQLVRACLRRELKLADRGDFCAGVMARLEVEAAAGQAAPTMGGRGTSWARLALGGAIAAGVAGLMLFASGPQPASAPAALAASQRAPAAPAGMSPNLVAQPVAGRSSIVLDPQIGDAWIDGYLVRHSGAVASLGRSGTVPYAYAVALRSRTVATPAGTTAVDPNLRPVSATGEQRQ